MELTTDEKKDIILDIMLQKSEDMQEEYKKYNQIYPFDSILDLKYKIQLLTGIEWFKLCLFWYDDEINEFISSYTLCINKLKYKINYNLFEYDNYLNKNKENYLVKALDEFETMDHLFKKKKYDILYKNSNNTVKYKEFLDHFINGLEDKKENICLGISQNGNKCCRKAQDNSNYCKVHFYLEFRNKEDNQKRDTIFIINENNKDNKFDVKKQNLQKVFIEDSFYYKDDKFIYDTFKNPDGTINYQKVGYIENNELILTDDPFILGI